MQYLVLDIEAVRDEAAWSPPADSPDAFAPPYAWRPICIGCVLLERTGDRPLRPVRVGVIEGVGADPAERERSLLEQFTVFVRNNRPELVTWNGRRFDVPVIMLRSLGAGIPQPWYYVGRGARYRYSEEGHCDLADAMADYGATAPLALDGLARLVGLPGKFGDIDGAGVADAFAAGRTKEIGDYCLADAAQTAFLWLRWLWQQGRFVTVDEYRASAKLLLAACESTGRLGPLLERVSPRVLLLEDVAADAAA